MFAFTTDHLRALSRSSQPVRTLRNALLESWVLHVRNLLSFIYDDRARSDDAMAGDFLDQDWPTERGAEPKVLRMAHAKASKQIARLSYHRTGVTEQEKTWDVEPILSDVTSALRTFTVLVSQSRVQDDFRDRIDAALPPSAPAWSAHGPRFATTSTISPDQLKGPAPR